MSSRWSAGRESRPRVDLVERPKDYRLFVDLPGTPAEDISLDLKQGVLSLRARIGSPREVAGGERRSLPLPDDPRPVEPLGGQPLGGQSHGGRPVGDQPLSGEWCLQVDFGGLLSAADELSAVYDHGVLLVTLPKAAGLPADARDEGAA